MHMYGQRAAQNGRLWVTFFVTKYRDLFFVTKGAGWGGGPAPLYPSQWALGYHSPREPEGTLRGTKGKFTLATGDRPGNLTSPRLTGLRHPARSSPPQQGHHGG